MHLNCSDRLAVDRVCAARDRAADRGKGGGVDRLELHRVAGHQKRRRRSRRVEKADRRRPDQVPAAGTLIGIDRGQGGGDRNRAGRDPHPRVGASRQGQRRRQIAQIRKAGQKAQHVDVVPRAAVQCHDLAWRQPGQPRHLGEIGGEFALVAHRDMPKASIGVGALVAVEQPGDDLL